MLIKRDVYFELLHDLKRKEFAFLIGPRQAGKTTLMMMLQEALKRRGEKTLFLSLDFESDRGYFTSQKTLIKKIELEIGNKGGFVFIDEIQRKEDAGRFLKGIYDMGLSYKFIISGSGSIELKAGIKESMVGRKRVYEIGPVSLREFMNFRTDNRYEGHLEKFLSIERAEANRLLMEYLNFGGYPRVILETEQKEKIRTIDEIYRGYIEKDIAYILKVEKIEAFGLLIKLMADQIGGLINYSELSSTLGISLPTLKNYLWYAENTYILQRITPYFRNVRKEIGKSPTVYFSDIGLRNYMLNIFGNLNRPDDIGFAFQNLVFLVLKEKLRWKNAKIHYWRTKAGSEIDFVIEMGRERIPVEVKFRELSSPVVPRSFNGFIEKYAPKRCIVVNRNLMTSVNVNGSKVLFFTIWDLMFWEIEGKH